MMLAEFVPERAILMHGGAPIADPGRIACAGVCRDG